MKRDGILNPELIAAIASVGHTEYFVIADPGLPITCEAKVVDISLTKNIPTFLDALRAVTEEMVTESFILASEMPEKSPELYKETCSALEGLPHKLVPHEEFKELVKDAKAILRTGETTSFANVILVGGVNF